MNPPEVSVEVEEWEVVMEFLTELMEMAGEVVREFEEEELGVLRELGRLLEQYVESAEGWFEEYE